MSLILRGLVERLLDNSIEHFFESRQTSIAPVGVDNAAAPLRIQEPLNDHVGRREC